MQIDIDFEVFKALTARRESESVTYNDVLRTLLGLRPSNETPTPTAAGDWVSKGVRFPEGTDFRASYGGTTHYAKVERGGLFLNGRKTKSPSDAARLVTGNNVNGWVFWECRFPGEDRWQSLKALRPRQ